MDEPKFPDQKARLHELLRITHLSADEIAGRVGIKAETFQKYLNGYQPCGKQTLNRIQDVVNFELERMGRASAKNPELQLHEEAMRYGRQFLKLSPEKRELVKNLMNQLSGDVDKIADTAGRRAIGDVTKPTVTYGRRKTNYGAAKPSSHKP